MNAESKVTTEHLKRAAYLYIRQSTLRQVFENTESTQRQYALRRRAVALGWPEERIVVIDEDQGQSGASTTEREGFQRFGGRCGIGQGRHRDGLGGFAAGSQLRRLAPAVGDLRAHAHADLGRRRTLRSGP